MTREQFIAECRRRSEAGENEEDIIGYLRASGCSKLEFIAVVKGAFGIDLTKAKEIVHFSPTWKDRLTADEQFHDDILGILTNGQPREPT